MNLAEIREIYAGSDGEATSDLYGKLVRKFGRPGEVAVALFRMSKKHNRYVMARPRFLEKAKDSLDWSVHEAVEVIALYHSELRAGSWGWKTQGQLVPDRHHLLVDIPTGQCCFRLENRGAGLEYQGDYRPGNTPNLIMRWIELMFNPKTASIQWTGARQLDLD